MFKDKFDYTEYLLNLSIYKKFIFTELIFSKEGDFLNELYLVDENGDEDTIKFIATTLITKIGFALPYKRFKCYLNAKVFYYSHPFLNVYKRYSLKDTIVYKFKKYAFSLDLGTGMDINENIYLFLLLENVLKTKLDYGIGIILTGSPSIFVSNLPFTARAGLSYTASSFKFIFLVSHFLGNKFGGSEIFIDQYIQLKPEMSLIINYKKDKNLFNFSFSNKFYPEYPAEIHETTVKTRNIFEFYLGYMRKIKNFKIGGGIKFDTRFIELEKMRKEVKGKSRISPFNIFLKFLF